MDKDIIIHRRILQSDTVIALLIGVTTLLLLVVTAPHIGLTWDEPTYIVAAEKYPQWYGELITHSQKALQEEEITKYWELNSEHPPLSKVWSGFIWLGARYLFDHLTAHRLGNMILASILAALVYLLLVQESGRTAGFVAVAALFTMPRFFFHAHLAALDVPVAVMIFAVTYVFWLGRDTPNRIWTILLGLVWGLAVATKINGLFIPPIIITIWILIFKPRFYLFQRLFWMVVIGVCFFVVSWPWLYYDTFNRFIAYLGFLTIDRYPTEQFYFGNLYAAPFSPLPWHFPIIVTILVVPLTLIILSTIGAFSSVRNKEERQLVGLLLLGVFTSIAVFVIGPAQAFDNERLFMPAFPYLAALAGLGFVRVISYIQYLSAKRKIILIRNHAVLILAVLSFTPQLLLSSDLYPHLLSYYSEAIGGPYGAKVLNMETTYWCESYSQTIDYLNAYTTTDAIVWAECQDVLIYYQLQGKLRKDLKIANGPDAKTAFAGIQLNTSTFGEADYVVIQYRQSGFYRSIREWIIAREPVFEMKYRQLRLAEIYVQ
jgi:4-amino-4-deoxy-L-arabinose transferase-like glycosyltransferase